MLEMTAQMPHREVEERIRTLWEAPSLLDPVMGNPGFALPDLDNLFCSQIATFPTNWILSRDHASEWTYKSLAIRAAANAKNNILVLERDAELCGQLFLFGSNNIGVIRQSSGYNPINIHFNSDNCFFYWGKDSTSNTATFRVSGNNTNVIVGEDCMFSSGINVQSHDDHSIVDLESGLLLNPPGSVYFGPHAWIGRDCTVLKGVRVGFGAIVGTRSVVTRDVPAKTIVVGSPARPVRSNVGWLRERKAGGDALIRLQAIEKRLGINLN
jgi:acetyltransferase-like isoleucine patch superfamily enzyme